jgi:hypothetical protein
MVMKGDNAYTGLQDLTVTYTLGNPILDPAGSPKSIRKFQRIMFDNLQTVRPIIEAQLAAQIASGAITEEDIWDTNWNIQEDGTFFGTPGAKTYLSAHPTVPALVSDNPPTGNLPPLGGRILQIQRGVNAAGDAVFQDILGIEGAEYYPGSTIHDQIFMWPLGVGDPMFAIVPFYNPPYVVYARSETLRCSDTRHRIHNSPVYVRADVKEVQDFFTFGPDGYPAPAVPVTGFPVDSYNRIQFDTVCPNPFGSFFFSTGDDYVVFQIYCLNPATNINGFVIPP